MLLLCALIVGSSNVWAADTTIGVGSSSLTWTADGDDYKATSGDFILRYEKGTYASAISGGIQSAELRLYSGTNFVISSIHTITKIVYNVADGTGKNYSVAALSTEDGNLSEGTWTGSATSVSASLSAQNRIKSVTITYTASAKTDPTISFNDGNVRVGKTLDLSDLFTSDSDGDVTYSITAGDSYASLDGKILTGVAEGSVTVKAEQAATGAYNAGEATATITVAAALTLSSIAITTAPSKTTYTEGETFDATDMVVTATYSDATTDDVTALCTFTPSGALTTSDTEITVSYTENAVEKTATQAITVNPYVQPTTVTIQMTNSLFGEEVHTSGTASSDLAFVGVQDRVTVTYNVPNGSYYYFNTSNTRPYNTCTLTYGAPTGFVITQIEFTSDGSNWNNATPSVGEMTNSKVWEGVASSVTFSWETSGTRIKTVVVTLAETAIISLNAACNDGNGNIFGTYSNSSAFVVPAELTVSAITSVDGGKLTITDYAEGDIVKANTGVLVSSTTDGDHTILLSNETGTEISGNMLKASGDAGIKAATMNVADTKFYRLTMHNGTQIGFWWGAAEGAAFDIAANKAYLAVPKGSGAREGLWFNDDVTTSINEMRSEGAEMNNVYNLNGQRVAQPTRGLYIVNGKKVIVK